MITVGSSQNREDKSLAASGVQFSGRAKGLGLPLSHCLPTADGQPAWQPDGLSCSRGAMEAASGGGRPRMQRRVEEADRFLARDPWLAGAVKPSAGFRLEALVFTMGEAEAAPLCRPGQAGEVCISVLAWRFPTRQGRQKGGGRRRLFRPWRDPAGSVHRKPALKRGAIPGRPCGTEGGAARDLKCPRRHAGAEAGVAGRAR